ncbi:MAG: Xaa-Pro dipeptidase [Gammaproteobacteria bacterium]|nr:MAG: Xaa-Pro dipeptidase [Gammaproteobacteria bacterium]
MSRDLSTQPSSPAYAAHVAGLCARYEAAAARGGFDAIAVGSGQLEYRFQDDQAHPFVASAHFLQWVPLGAHPGSAVLFEPGRRPVLVVLQPEDYWHQPPALPAEEFAREFELRVIRDPGDLAALLPGAGQRLALLGPEAQWDGLGPVVEAAARNPPVVVNHLHYHRATKSSWELACMRGAAAIAAPGHQAALRAFRAGASEYDILAAFLAGCRQTEPELPYGAIVALNGHGATLHYQHRDRQPLAARDVHSLLIDAGCAFNGYACDITRSHAFRDDEFAAMIAGLDDLQQQLCAAVRPGLAFADLHRCAHQGVADLLQSWGLVRMAQEDMIREQVTFAFFPHGLGHLLGLQVHDVGGHMADEAGNALQAPPDFPRLRFLRRLEPGQVVTIEPGIYFIGPLLERLRASPAGSRVDWDRIAGLMKYGGIRIEDDVLVTAGEPENLTRPLLGD